MPLAKDLLHSSLEEEKKKHKKKCLVQSPNSCFMDVKCPGYYKICATTGSPGQVVLCVGSSTELCHPTGGKARLTEADLFWCPSFNKVLNAGKIQEYTFSESRDHASFLPDK
uniref:Uncharacterized protein n=1 Tax=Sus scrofa TaxID=9823 RepID=A0A8D0WUZ4_PIG